VSGVVAIRPTSPGVKQSPPLPVIVELADGRHADSDLAERIARDIRDTLTVNAAVTMAPWGELPRSDYKSKLVDWSNAAAKDSQA
jgi:phenylacetate-CoA ligase